MAAKRRRKDPSVPPLEWAAGLVGLVIVGLTLAVIGYEAYRGERDAPDLRVEMGRPTPVSGGRSVRVVVQNAGRRAAVAVIVEGSAGDVRSEAQIEHVAGLSSAEAVLVFPESADLAGLSVRVVGYTVP
jgi:uncharacterized protein (TIGR02588 family)